MKRFIFAIFILMQAAVALCSPLEVSWLTAEPGHAIYELEGHSALRLRNDSIDVVVNWGVFDFNAPGFVWRFCIGETNYFMVPTRYEWFVDAYSHDGRQVTEQKLNINDAQARRLYALIDSTLNAPHAGMYRYNYVLDNCSTRPRDYIEMATGHKIIFPQDTPGQTFRERMAWYHRDYPWYQFGIDLALGSGIDYPISTRESGFAPVAMLELLNEAYFDDEARTPLVSSSAIVNAGELAKIDEPLHLERWLSPLALGCALLAIVLLLVWKKQYRKILWLYTIFFGLEGLAGCLLTFTIFVSTHYATSPNYVYLWLNPLSLFIAGAVWFKGSRAALIACHLFNILASAALGVIFALGIQGYNLAFFPLMAISLTLSAKYLYSAFKK